MKLLKIEYQKEGELLVRVIKVLIADDLTTAEIREEVCSQILDDLRISMFSWSIKESVETK